MDTLSWTDARAAAHAAGLARATAPTRVRVVDAINRTLAEPLTPLTDLPAFPTSTVDGYAVRGAAPWRLTGRVLAGAIAPALRPGEAIEVATGAMVPAGTEQIIRLEHATLDGTTVTGTARPVPEWREPGDEAAAGEELLPAGTVVTPTVAGLAAACGHDELLVRLPPVASVVVFGDELLSAGPPGQGRVRDSLGPQVPGWLRLLGAGTPRPRSGETGARGPIEDTLEAHVAAVRDELRHAELVCTTGGTMRGPVDHLHPALERLDADYVADSVGVRPGFPMLLAAVGDRFVAGLPGNPQSAIVALVSLVQPLIDGLLGRPLTPLRTTALGAAVPGRGEDTHLALVRVVDGVAQPLVHSASSMLRGLAQATGFAVIPPGSSGAAGDRVAYLPLPAGGVL